MKIGNSFIGLRHGIAFNRFWQVKAPWCAPIFSESYGYKKPALRFAGFRIFRLDPNR